MKTRGKSYLMPGAFRCRIPRWSPAVAELWRDYVATRSVGARNRLLELYLPLTFICAARLRKRNPVFYMEDIDELASDGVLGLIRAIEADKQGGHAGFWRFASKRIHGEIHRQTAARRAFGGRGALAMDNIIAAVRSELVQREGRLPSRQELADAIDQRITNPQFARASDYIDRAKMQPLSRAALSVTDPHAAGLEDLALSRETVSLALKGLSGDDRKILKLLLRGLTPAEIGRKLNILPQTVRSRLNGVCWEARMRADLAEHLAVERWVGPAPHRDPTHLKTIDEVRPARRVASA